MLGFLWWNRPPARIFLGDVGSVPIGFMLGWLLLQAAAAGLWAPALILPLYYLADASLTLARRALRGEKVWRAHREHFYQIAVRGGRGHGVVSGAVAVANVALIALSAVALATPWFALVGAVVVVAVLMFWMQR
jgi:UDP-N-acetylmuramyl pentapeptide phosphotransferase/UDP-N-acetylglucosamine-1-phosphate transferase